MSRMKTFAILLNVLGKQLLDDTFSESNMAIL